MARWFKAPLWMHFGRVPCSLNWLASIGFDSVSFCPLIAVPILALAVFAISLCISLVLSRLPIVGKWIV